MATPNAAQIYRASCRVAINPTDLATAWPHGGTGLGVCSQIRLMTGLDEERVRAEEFGNQAVDTVLRQGDLMVATLVRQWSDDALATVFPNTTAGSAARVINWPGASRSGTLMTGRAVKLLFTADRQTEHPSLIVYKAIPLVSIQAELRLTVLRELDVPIIFLGVRDGSSRIASMGVLSDLSL